MFLIIHRGQRWGQRQLSRTPLLNLFPLQPERRNDLARVRIEDDSQATCPVKVHLRAMLMREHRPGQCAGQLIRRNVALLNAQIGMWR